MLAWRCSRRCPRHGPGRSRSCIASPPRIEPRGRPTVSTRSSSGRPSWGCGRGDRGTDRIRSALPPTSRRPCARRSATPRGRTATSPTRTRPSAWCTGCSTIPRWCPRSDASWSASPGRLAPTCSARSWSSCCIPACPTSTRAASSSGWRWSTPTTDAPTTSPARRRPSSASTRARLPEGLDDEKQLLVATAAQAATRAPRVVRRGCRLRTAGVSSDHLFGFARAGRVAVVVSRLVAASPALQDATIALPPGRWNSLLAPGLDPIETDGRPVAVGSRLDGWPVALLVAESDQ